MLRGIFFSQGIFETESVDSMCDEGIQSDFLE
jgi:hypothetical protein